ncbi:hypothetical protein B0H34DRAFT_758364 [Crassisporium funariophilum]|nr:hypothetical protein B0H34DRAFT_758364 [Crassisporium funariophilum]
MKIASRIRSFVSSHIPRASLSILRRSSTTRKVSCPMDRLPNELLTYIFLLTANDAGESPIFSSTISHVCARWRQVALSTGGLWGRIVLTFPITASQLSCASAWLARSRASPLDILLDLRDSAWEWEEDTHRFRWQDMQPILSLFIVHVVRWRKFEILSDTWLPIFTFLWYTRGVEAAPFLETLSLSRCNAFYASRGQVFQPTSLRPAIQLFGGIALNRLRDVTLVGVHIDWSQPSLRNLTHLELRYQAADVMPTLTQFHNIVLACQCLVHLSIIGWGPQLENSIPVTLQLPSLTRFTFGYMDTNYAIKFLSLFDFPSLEEFVLEDISSIINPVDVLDATPVLEWLASSHQQSQDLPFSSPRLPFHIIRTVEFHGIRSHGQTFVQFLRKFPSLTRLGCYHISDDALLALIPTAHNDLVCPALAELHCQDVVNVEVLIAVVSSRVGPAHPLQKVTLEFVRNPAPSPGSGNYTRLISKGIHVIGRSGSESSDDSQMTS